MDEKLRKIQLCELEILKEIARICDKNGIHYYLAAGTMLGAVRHQGFIPWDDDADIYMTMEDFWQFEKCCKKDLGSKFFLQTPKSEPYLGQMFFKVRMNGTFMSDDIEKSRLKNQGIWVDIFPMINCADDLEKREEQIKYCQRLQKIRWLIDPLDKASLLGKVIISQRNWKLRQEEKSLWEKVYQLGSECDENYFIVSNIFMEGMEYNIPRDILKKDLFRNRKQYCFEDSMFWGVEDFDAYLSQMYGLDYMIPKNYGAHTANFDNVIV